MAQVFAFHGITGQGAADLATQMLGAPAVETLEGRRLRFSMPSVVCPYCIGETSIGRDHQRGSVRKMNFDEHAP